jgi:hypothetical protein
MNLSLEFHPVPKPEKQRKRSKSREFSEKVKAIVRSRSMGVCEMCGVEQAVHFHHCIFKSQLGTGELENCLHLGLKCHERAHAERRFREACVERSQALARKVQQ